MTNRTASLVRIATFVLLIVSLFWLSERCSGEPAFASDVTVEAPGTGATRELPLPCPFVPGWNFVTLGGTPADLPSCVSVAWGYDGATDEWQFWGRGEWEFWNDLKSFTLGRGYWLWVPA